MAEGRLSFNVKSNRYGLLKGDLWSNGNGFHCGDCMEVYLNGEWIPTRIEMDLDRKWYLVGTDLEGDDLEGIKVKV